MICETPVSAQHSNLRTIIVENTPFLCLSARNALYKSTLLTYFTYLLLPLLLLLQSTTTTVRSYLNINFCATARKAAWTPGDLQGIYDEEIAVTELLRYNAIYS